MSTTAAATSTTLTNHWGKTPLKPLAVTSHLLYTGHAGHYFSHQTQLTTDATGRLVATWSLGAVDEEAPFQSMVMATSSDNGETWSAPRTIVAGSATTVIVSAGILRVGNDLLAYAGEWERPARGLNPDGTRTTSNDPTLYENIRTSVHRSHDHGATWTRVAASIGAVANYMPPVRLLSGRLLLAGNQTCLRTDDPQGIAGWERATLPGVPDDFPDDFFHAWYATPLERPYTEGCVYQTDDGVVRMIFRVEDRNCLRLAVSESHDDGVSWSSPVLSDFTDTMARSHLGRLPDGRFFALNCPEPVAKKRTPVVLALSHDGLSFSNHYLLGNDPTVPPRQAGFCKHGRYGYPYLHLHGEYGFAIYSWNKEDIALLRFRLADLL